MSNTNNYNAGVPASGTQAHRERQFPEHEQGAAYGQQQGFNPGVNQGFTQPGVNQGQNQPGLNQPGLNQGFTQPTAGNAGFQGTGTGVGTNAAVGTGAAPAPATMSERANEPHGRGHHQGQGVGATSTTTGSTKPHMGDKVMGATQAAIGRAINNPAMEQAGLERQTFGDSKRRPTDTATGVPTTGTQPLQQNVAPGGVPTQQGFNNPNTGFTGGTGPRGAY